MTIDVYRNIPNLHYYVSINQKITPRKFVMEDMHILTAGYSFSFKTSTYYFNHIISLIISMLYRAEYKNP